MMTLALMAMITQAGAEAPDTTPVGVEKLPVVREFPNPFVMRDGTRVATPSDWAKRRAEIQEILLDYEYGHLAPPPGNVRASEVASTPVLDGAATEKRMRLTCGPHDGVRFDLILTLPVATTGPRPVILDGDRCWGPVHGVEEAVRRGYIVAEFDRTELDSDNADHLYGVHRVYSEPNWATLAAWAWGFHRAVDYLLTVEGVDPKRIIITGHSRGGKCALLAGALDERVALVAPNDSGCGGAGSYRFSGGGSEGLQAILKNFPYWFVPGLKEFIGREEHLPFDQHFLWALVAPRPLLVTNALGDPWANPEGTQRMYLAAKEVYRFLGAEERVGIHYRPGKHEHNVDDWHTLLDFADQQLFGRQVETRFDTLPFPVEPKGFSWAAPGK